MKWKVPGSSIVACLWVIFNFNNTIAIELLQVLELVCERPTLDNMHMTWYSIQRFHLTTFSSFPFPFPFPGVCACKEVFMGSAPAIITANIAQFCCLDPNMHQYTHLYNVLIHIIVHSGILGVCPVVQLQFLLLHLRGTATCSCTVPK